MLRLLIFIFFLPLFLTAQTELPPRGEVYRNDVVPQIFIEIDPADLDEIFAEGNEYSNTEHPATFIFDNGTIRDTVENIGFRLRGNTSRLADKKSFKVSFNTFESQTFYGLEKMNLNGEHNDPSVVRARVCWELLRWLDLPGARANHTQLYVNGDYYGVYANVEHFDENFVKAYFDNDEGNLYKCIFPADMDYKGSNPEAYKEEIFGRRAYQLKTNTERDDYGDFAELVDIVNNTPLDDLECELERVLNVENYLKYIAFDVLTGNWDGPHYNKNNFYLYRNAATGKFEYIPYDLDNTLGIDWVSRDWSDRDMYDWARHGDTGRPFYTRVLEVPAFRARYSLYTQQILEQFFNEDFLFPYLDDLKNQLLPHVTDDPFYPQDYGFSLADFTESFENELPYFQTDFGIKEFVTLRRENSLEQLEIEALAPLISEVTHNFPVTGEDLIFTAKVSDDSDNFSVQICYTPAGADEPICAAMQDDGTQNDGAANDGLFGFILENTAAKGLTYFIEATDSQQLTNRIPTCGARTVQVTGDLVINEIMARNETTVADETGAYEDWIELYNRGSESIDLGNYFLTDNHNIPGKWQLPKTDLPADSYLLIWADNDPEDGTENHANFRLAGSEEVGLFQKNNDAFTATDLLRYEDLADDESLARVPNGTGDFALNFSTPDWNNNNLSDLENPETKNAFHVFPNPNAGSFSVISQQPNEVYVYEIYDLRGRLLHRKEEQSGVVGLRINNHSEGVFVLKISDNRGGVFCRKVVVE